MTATIAAQAVATVAKSVAQRAARKRYSFGPVWNAAVVAGKVTDQAKLLEQAITLKVGAKSDLRKLKLATLRTKVAARLEADMLANLPATETVETVEAAPAAEVAAA